MAQSTRLGNLIKSLPGYAPGKVVPGWGTTPVMAVLDLIMHWQNQAPLEAILIGNGTSSEYWQNLLLQIAPLHVVEERGSTLRARHRYWELWPPSNWRRWLPRGMILPPHHLDAIAAMVLLEDHLGQQLLWPGPPNFKIGP